MDKNPELWKAKTSGEVTAVLLKRNINESKGRYVCNWRVWAGALTKRARNYFQILLVTI